MISNYISFLRPAADARPQVGVVEGGTGTLPFLDLSSSFLLLSRPQRSLLSSKASVDEASRKLLNEDCDPRSVSARSQIVPSILRHTLLCRP